MKPRSYSVKEVYDATLLAFTFEFYCSKNPSFIINDLKEISGKNVVFADQYVKDPTYTTSILLKEYDGKRPRYQFKIGYQPFEQTPTFLNTLLFWINENASLDFTTKVKTKLIYDFNKLKTLTTISNMDIGKMVLKIDENYMYERFQDAKDSPYSMTVKKLIPYNMSCNASNVVNLNTNFMFMIGEQYGIDFTDQTRGELTFNYIIGPDYSEKSKEIQEVLEYYIITTYQTLNTDDYTNSMINELNVLTEEYRNFRKCYYDPEKFEKSYKDLKVYVDLNRGPAILETKWLTLRDTIAKLILEGNIKKCKFNLDTETGLYQIKDAEATNSILKGFQLIDSKVSGVIEHCHFWKSEVENSVIKNSTFVNDNKVNGSYITNARFDRNNKLEESYVINSGEIINCEVNECIIKNAGIGEKARLDENCILVNPKEHKIQKPNILEIKETRDYRWIKTLRGTENKSEGYGNEYKED